MRELTKVAAEAAAAVDGAILSEGHAGLEAQAFGLSERAGLLLEARRIAPVGAWRHLPARWWPNPPARVRGLDRLPDGLLFAVGGTGGAVAASLRQRDRRVVQIQNPRMRLDRFDLVVANTHDEIDGPNVLLSRTALHRVTAAALARARSQWQPRLSHLPRPLVSVLVGGANGRFRLGEAEAALLAGRLAAMMRDQGVGVALTPSRRTAPAALAVLERTLSPLGALVWDGSGDNPYLGLLACADAIVATADSVSMVSEAAATGVPVLVQRLPGRSRRIGLFLRGLIDAGRIRTFNGGIESWDVAPLDDTGAVAAEMCRRLGLPGSSRPAAR